jgi:IMP dehydrogenase/GMP reductase
MKDATELLMRIIAHETKYVESMCHSLKEDGLTILRLQNKSRNLEEEIEGRKQLVEEYRGYIKYISEEIYTRLRLVPSTEHQMDTDLSTTNLEHQA